MINQPAEKLTRKEQQFAVAIAGGATLSAAYAQVYSDRAGRRAAEANAGVAVDIPTAVGFCMYVRRECLLQTGLFREDLFAQGYGEENDFCLRARHLGFADRRTMGIIGRAADKAFFDLEMSDACHSQPCRNFLGLGLERPGV